MNWCSVVIVMWSRPKTLQKKLSTAFQYTIASDIIPISVHIYNCMSPGALCPTFLGGALCPQIIGHCNLTINVLPTFNNYTIYSTISMKHKQLYHILDYVQHLGRSCVGRNGCGIRYKKRLKNTNVCYLLKLLFSSWKFVWLINTFPTWCIVNHEMDSLVYVKLYFYLKCLTLLHEFYL